MENETSETAMNGTAAPSGSAAVTAELVLPAERGADFAIIANAALDFADVLETERGIKVQPEYIRAAVARMRAKP
jgi:hypothetical protein